MVRESILGHLGPAFAHRVPVCNHGHALAEWILALGDTERLQNVGAVREAGRTTRPPPYALVPPDEARAGFRPAVGGPAGHAQRRPDLHGALNAAHPLPGGGEARLDPPRPLLLDRPLPSPSLRDLVYARLGAGVDPKELQDRQARPAVERAREDPAGAAAAGGASRRKGQGGGRRFSPAASR